MHNLFPPDLLLSRTIDLTEAFCNCYLSFGPNVMSGEDMSKSQFLPLLSKPSLTCSHAVIAKYLVL